MEYFDSRYRSIDMRRYFTYIMSNKYENVLYVGVTNNIKRRVREHRLGVGARFTSKYRIVKLLYVEESRYVLNAIAREKQLKRFTRAKKEELIDSLNPQRLDLYDEWFSD